MPELVLPDPVSPVPVEFAVSVDPLSLAFAHDGRFLVTSGAMRPVCWGFDPPGADVEPRECGIASKTPVTCVACHPRQYLIAAGYHNGAVLLCQPGSDEGLFA